MAEYARRNRLPLPKGVTLALPLGEAIPPLAELWRATRSPRVADQLVRLSAAYSGFFSPLPRRGPCFEALLAARDDRLLGLLLAGVTRQSEPFACDRLLNLWRAWPHDPRTTAHLTLWKGAYASGTGAFSRLSARIMTRAGSASGLTLQSAESQLPTLEAYADARVPAQHARELNLADDVVLAEAEVALDSLPRRRKALTVLHDIYRYPSDVSRRLVFAALLMDLGDAWGELIALQCYVPRGNGPGDEARRAARIRELLAAHGETLLGRLAPFVHASPPPVFAGGFPSVVLATRSPRVTGLPEWSTVNKVDAKQRELRTASLAARLKFERPARVR